MLLGLGLVLAPVGASAQVTITEIMYDAKGGDTGNEWLEITNLGSDAVDVGKYKLFESNTNHSLTLSVGDAVLTSGTSAIITTDPGTFVAGHTYFSGTLFKASFSLSNMGETILLKDASSTLVDSMTYGSSMGANGDGASLHRTFSGTWRAGKPDPGVYTGTVTAMPTHIVSTTPPAQHGATPNAARTPASTADTARPSAASTTSSSPKSRLVPQTDPVSPTPDADTTSLIEGVFGLVAVILLGVASVWYAKKVTEQMSEETSPSPEEFDIES